MKKRLLSRLDLWVIGTLLLLAGLLAFLFWLSPKSVRANIYVKGELVQTVPLEIDREWTVEGNFPVKLRISDGEIAFVKSSCHDQICIGTGTLTRAGSTAACLPAGVVIRLSGNGEELDGVTY